jgi:glycosyltransferase involved in cell wall biosynthesis
MSKALAKRGHDVTVVCYGHGEGEADPDYRVLRTPRLPGYHNMRAGPDFVKPFLDLALAQRIASVDSDVVHAHNYEAPIAAALARLRTRTPIVYNAHNTMVEELPSYFEGAAARRVAGRIGRWLDQRVPRLAEHAVALNPGSVGTLRALGCSAVSLVQPGVDVADFDGVVPARLPDGPWVVYAGNPDRYQDLDVLIEAMGHLPDCGLLLVSASPLDAWAHCGLERLKLIQTRDFGEVKSLVKAAQVAVIPRTMCSGYPIKLLNSLALGVPTVVAEGSAQTLPGVVVVPNHDPVAMASEIRRLVQNDTLRRRLGEQASAHIRAACTWDARAHELERVYARVLTQACGQRL